MASGLLALIAGAGVSSEWNSWLLFTHARDFGIEDPQFGTDIGFYVFRLPFLSFLAGWLFAALLIVLIVTAVAHYLNGGIRMSAQRNRVTPQVKAHLSVLLGLLALVKAGGYWLQRFDLTVSSRGFVDGAGYTDVKAQLPAINLLLLISIASFLLFIVNIWRRGWTLPILGVGLWALIAVVAGAIYPQFVQRVQVDPERAREGAARTSQRNIEATQEAMGLTTDDIEVVPFDLETDKDRIDLTANEASVSNIRIWDPSRPSSGGRSRSSSGCATTTGSTTSTSTATSSTASPTQVVLSVRDLNTGNVPRDTWAAKHLTYTHGYGAIVAPANAKEAERRAVVRRQGRALRQRRRRARAHPAGRVLRRGAVRLRGHGHQAAGAQLPGRRGDAVRRLRGRGRRGPRQPAQAGRVRPPLRRRQPADLRPADRRLEDPLRPRHPGAGVRRWRRSCTTTPTPTR